MTSEQLDHVCELTRKVGLAKSRVTTCESKIINARETIRKTERLLEVDRQYLVRAERELAAYKEALLAGSVVRRCGEMCNATGLFCELDWGHPGLEHAATTLDGKRHTFFGKPG